MNSTLQQQAIQALRQIPGVGISIAHDLWNIGITAVHQLRGKDPETLYRLSNEHAGAVQDPCLLYTFRCAVYFAETEPELRDPVKLKWWYWKNNTR
jgi:hypothetical protein